MIFVLADYMQYRRRAGRYRRHPRNGLMAMAWERMLPDDVLDMLEEGDTLFVMNFNSFISWSIMYVTSSLVSHVGLYCSGRRLMHMTLSGSAIEPIEMLFSDHVRILPAKLGQNRPMLASKQSMADYHRSLPPKPYGYLGVLRKGLRILSGRNWYYFRWKFFCDIALAIFALDIIIALLSGRVILSWFVLAYLTLILFNRVRWKFAPVQPDNENGVPADAIAFIRATEGTLVGDAAVVRDAARSL